MGVDVDAALTELAAIPISLHCWRGDDVGCFETVGVQLPGDGIQATGNYPGKARPLSAFRVPEGAQYLGSELAGHLRREKAIMGIFDEGCMGMYNAIVPDEKSWERLLQPDQPALPDAKIGQWFDEGPCQLRC